MLRSDKEKETEEKGHKHDIDLILDHHSFTTLSSYHIPLSPLVTCHSLDSISSTRGNAALLQKRPLALG